MGHCSLALPLDPPVTTPIHTMLTVNTIDSQLSVRMGVTAELLLGDQCTYSHYIHTCIWYTSHHHIDSYSMRVGGADLPITPRRRPIPRANDGARSVSIRVVFESAPRAPLLELSPFPSSWVCLCQRYPFPLRCIDISHLPGYVSARYLGISSNLGIYCDFSQGVELVFGRCRRCPYLPYGY